MEVKLIAEDTLGVFFAYDHDLVNLVKSLGGMEYSDKGRFWYCPTSSPALSSTLETLQAQGFTVPDGVLSRLAKIAPVLEPPIASFESTLPLYPYQKEICAYMVNAGNCLNASFVGSGKTLTSLAVCEYLKAQRVLILAPKSVVLQWAEIEGPKWLPQRKFVPVSGSLSVRARLYASFTSGYMVMGYETARSDIELLSLKDFDIIICDEAHRLANPSTKLYKALKKLKTKHRFGLTATPVMNSATDMFGIINWINPGSLGNYWQFMTRYCVKDMWGSVKHFKNMDELADRCKPFIIKKTLDEVDLQLPDYTEVIVPVELSAHERKNYDLIKKELLFDIEKSVISKIENPVMLQSSVVKLGKLFEICDSLELIGDSIESSKLEVLKEHLESTLVNGQKAIIITRFSRMAEILNRRLSEAGHKTFIITGGTNNRQEIIKEFEAGQSSILIGTEAIGQGLNLQMANILYNYDSAWNPAKMEQRAGRIYRNGQTKPVFIYNLVVNKSVEGWLQKKLLTKAELSERLLPKISVEEVDGEMNHIFPEGSNLKPKSLMEIKEMLT